MSLFRQLRHIGMVCSVLLATTAHAHSVAAPTDITVESQMTEGKLHWTPALTTVANGSEVTLTVVNKLKDVEKFEVSGLVDPVDIAPGGSQTFTFDANISGTYFFKSSNHPGHAVAKIVVLR